MGLNISLTCRLVKHGRPGDRDYNRGLRAHTLKGSEEIRITFIGHASLLIEANGLSIVSDPWWDGPCFGAQWWPYPMPYAEAVRDRRIDYVYVLHGHHDHFHPPTLRLFQEAKVLVAAGSVLAQGIRGLRLEFIECGGDGETDLGLRVRGRISRPRPSRNWRGNDGADPCDEHRSRIRGNEQVNRLGELTRKRCES